MGTRVVLSLWTSLASGVTRHIAYGVQLCVWILSIIAIVGSIIVVHLSRLASPRQTRTWAGLARERRASHPQSVRMPLAVGCAYGGVIFRGAGSNLIGPSNVAVFDSILRLEFYEYQ